ncbi:MAG: dihydroorotase [Bacteroidetes bacterium]|nr:dihydroorotase [Bacteroidota bacterium]MDA0903858.1 dihydroorotase [Bacteroidota bacterium]MDA1242848.1 dihydroorotase [Bacteroidota bacterium]
MPILFRQGHVVNEGSVRVEDLLVQGEWIVAKGVDLAERHEDPKIRALAAAAEVRDCRGQWVMPGCIDDQVHFREPGLTHKAEIATEAAAAAAGGITSFMEMPNTVPQTLDQSLLQEKYDRAEEVSPVNYSFFMGASNHNLDEVLKTDPKTVCGIKVFMGSSTGDMLVDEDKVLEGIFKEAPMLVATHCEDEATIRTNTAAAKATFGNVVPIAQHPIIRNAEACYRSSSKAVELATKLGTRLHILHISTARELDLFDGNKRLEDKQITAEACIHHLWFTDADYDIRGTHIKWNPAVKKESDRDAIRAALHDGRIDVVATDHAPHTIEEKNRSYFDAPSGGPLVQHALVAMLDLVHEGVLSLEQVADLMAHRVARCFQMTDRGFLRPGQKADLVVVRPNDPWTVREDNILAKCGWSPFSGHTFRSRVHETWVNGVLVWGHGRIQTTHGNHAGQRLMFHR